MMKQNDPSSEEKQMNKFDFDFRYYLPYSGPDLKMPGLYVFKTSDKDSTPYNHSISAI